jgi:two-component system phosphate regulon sensor histidine kinase PhoR
VQGLRVGGARTFWRLFASSSAGVLIAAALVYALVVPASEQALCASLEQGLRGATFLVERAAAASQSDLGDLGDALRRIKAETGYRATLIAADGMVLADSDQEPAQMDNHAGRPEVLAAQAGAYGVARRYSRTVGYELLYVARRVPLFWAEGGAAIARASAPLTGVEDALARTRALILLGAGVGLAAALGLGFLAARRTSAPLAELTQVAGELSRGNYAARVRDLADGEAGALGEALNRLAGGVAERLAHIAGEDARLRAMLAGMVEGVAAVDREDRIAFLNRAARELLGIRREDASGRRLWEVVRVAGLEELLAGARRSGAVERRELVLGGAGGRARTLEAHASPIRADAREGAEHGGLVVVFHDVTDLRRLERVRRDFVANVSHELKTPLAAIKGFVETLLDGASEDQDVRGRFLRRIDGNVDRLSHLVTDLLSLARIEGQGDAIQRVPVDLLEVVAAVTDRAQGSAARKGIALVLDPPPAPVVVEGDAEGLTQIANNLVENAINYTQAGEVRVRVGARGPRGFLDVEDTGVGIPAEDLQRIFERFYRVDKARSRELGGTGLGLSIVRNLVQAMRGEVRVASELGRGSLFTVELPLAARDGRAAEL